MSGRSSPPTSTYNKENCNPSNMNSNPVENPYNSNKPHGLFFSSIYYESKKNNASKTKKYGGAFKKVKY